MGKQKLSIEAAAAKKKRDLAYALTPARRKKKAHAQRMRNKAGSKANGMDWDHKDGKFKSVKANRGNDGNGTKCEGKKKYKFKAYERK
tara:strand:+ start:257 stop:520 length:264 start_codon:yes stop_codon:yes gene_type:complete